MEGLIVVVRIVVLVDGIADEAGVVDLVVVRAVVLVVDRGFR